MRKRIPPGALTPSVANALTQMLNRFDEASEPQTGPGMEASNVGGVPVLNTVGNRWIVAKITGRLHNGGGYSPAGYGYDETCRYSWVEVEVKGDDCTTSEIPGRAGYVDQYPAVEINNDTDVSTNTIVMMRLAPGGQFWLFQRGGGGDGTCCDAAPEDVIPIITEVNCTAESGLCIKQVYQVYYDCVPMYFLNGEEAKCISVSGQIMPNTTCPIPDPFENDYFGTDYFGSDYF